jgi:hypothetical protein
VRYRIPAISLKENHEKISQEGAKKVIFDLLVSYFGTCRMVAWYKEVIDT